MQRTMSGGKVHRAAVTLADSNNVGFDALEQVSGPGVR